MDSTSSRTLKRTQPVSLNAYRRAVAAVVREVTDCTGPEDARRAERILSNRLDDPAITNLFDRLPAGRDGAEEALHREVHAYQPSTRSAASDLSSLIRIWLLSQIDGLWWGQAPMFETDESVLASTDLVDLDALRRRGLLRFRYRRQPRGYAGRIRNGADRRLRPGRVPHAAGLRFPRARPEAVALLNDLATTFADAAAPGTPPLWITSTVRSVEHQLHLGSLGYSALLPSAHCAGYATDIELRWFRRFGEDETLARVLLDQQDRGSINVIDEGQAWHVCIHPNAGPKLLADYGNLVAR